MMPAFEEEAWRCHEAASYCTWALKYSPKCIRLASLFTIYRSHDPAIEGGRAPFFPDFGEDSPKTSFDSQPVEKRLDGAMLQG